MNDITTWIAADRPRNSLPAWARTIVQSSDGTVYVPAALGGNENHTLLCAAREGETLMRCHGHAYLRAEWMRAEFPEHAETVNVLELRVREAAAAEQAEAGPATAPAKSAITASAS